MSKCAKFVCFSNNESRYELFFVRFFFISNRFTSDRIESKDQHNYDCNAHIEDNETSCEVENDNVAEEDESLYDNNVYEESVGEEIVVEEKIVTEKVITGEIVNEKITDEEDVIAGNTTDDKDIDDEIDGAKIYEENVNVEKVDDEPAETKHVVEDDGVDSNEHADEIEHVDESDLDTERSSMNDSEATPLQTTLVNRHCEYMEKNFLFSFAFYSPNHVLLQLQSYPLDMLVFRVRVHQKLSLQPIMIINLA